MTIAITGATGQLGRLIVTQLKNKIPSDQIVALARSPDKASGLGVASRVADYNAPETLAAAVTGIDTLVLISSSEIGRRAAQHRNVIDAAKKAGVKWIVYTSLLHADQSPLSLAVEHRETEAALKASGVAYTVLRNGWYTENYTGSLPVVLSRGSFIGSAGTGRTSSAARSDYAAAAVAVLTSQGHAGQIYELAGDESYTRAQLAAEVSKQSGKTIAYVNLPEAEYAAALVGAGLPESLARAIAGWDIGISTDTLLDNGKKLSQLIGRATTPMSVTVAAALPK